VYENKILVGNAYKGFFIEVFDQDGNRSIKIWGSKSHRAVSTGTD